MCIDPQSSVWVKRGPKWIKIPKPCDNCWQCRENYVNDWVGRCLAEAATSQCSLTLSLTYAPPKNKGEFSHRVINPYHFQLFMKRLRKACHKVRYLVAGEYGEEKDRAHFHCILFFKEFKQPQGALPPRLENRQAFLDDHTIAQPLTRQMPNADMVHIREWPHGHVVADWSCTENSVRYCCEYIHQPGKKTNWFSMSKKPALGYDWFAEKAARNLDLCVMPATFEYMPPGGTPGKVYLMTGATRRDYLNLIVRDRSKRPQMSKWVRATFDKLERREFIASRADALLPPMPPCPAPWTEKGQLLLDRKHVKIASYAFHNEALAAWHAEAQAWGFDDVEEFKAFAEAGGCENHPEYFRGGPVNLPRSAGTGTCASAGQVAGDRSAVPSRPADRTAPRPPTGYDRQGRPYWGQPGRDYLPSAFAREGQNAKRQTSDDDAPPGMSPPAPEE
jgi:hypothetical protein